MQMNYTNDDMKYTPWCFMPPEMHFESPRDLKEAFWAFQLSRIQEELRGDISMNFLPTPGKFEKVRRMDGTYMLLPTSIDFGFLFRGQQGFYSPCFPTLYRQNLSKQELLIEKLRCIEFELYLKQLPQVEDFQKENLYIDYTGLCQHYGMKTDVLDLTNSLDVALFFAMCDLDENNHYQPKKNEGEYIGYIYAVPTMMATNDPKMARVFFENKICAIGMQPFARPGSQRGFSIHLEEGEELKALLYSFSYTKEDSKSFWNFFDEGKQLWDDDEISKVADQIKNTKFFTYRALNLCRKRFKEDFDTYKHDLVTMGCKFAKKQPWCLGDRERCRLRQNYLMEGGLSGLNEIVARKCFVGDRKYSCRSSEMILEELMPRFIFSGCAAPADYESDMDFAQSEDGKIWGLQKKSMNSMNQTKPNENTRKVDKWTGDWHDLRIDYNRDNPFKMKMVKMNKNSL